MPRKPKPDLVIREINDEVIQYWIGDTMLIEANHDDHGWSGMDGINTALTVMAECCGMAVRGEIEGEEFPDAP